MIDRLRTRLQTRLDAGRRDDGFTLIELLIVIVILGILAGIVVFAVGGITDRGAGAACKADRKTVEVAVEAYRAKVGTYPTAADSDARYLLLTGGVDRFLRNKPTNTTNVITIPDDAGTVVATPAC